MRRFINVSREYALILLVAICVIITIGTHFRMNTLTDDMSDIKAGYEVNIRDMVDSNADLKREVRLLDNRVIKLTARLEAKEEH